MIFLFQNIFCSLVVLISADQLRLQVLHTYKGNKSADKALIVAEYVGVQIDVPSDFEMGVTNKTPEFLKMNPIGKVCQHCWYLKFSGMAVSIFS